MSDTIRFSQTTSFVSSIFTDVYPGDGGLVVLPGSHKSEFERPENLFFSEPDHLDAPLHPALVNVTPKAGDVVIITEMLTHGVLVCKPKARDRRFLILRYKTQFFQDERGLREPFPPEVMDRPLARDAGVGGLRLRMGNKGPCQTG